MTRSASSASRRLRAPRPLLRALAAFAFAAAVVPAVALATAQPSAAAGAGNVTLSKSANIAVAGEDVTITGSGFDSSGTRGIYVMFCKQAAGEIGTAAGRAAGADCSAAQAWVTSRAMNGVTAWSGAGTFEVTMNLASTFKTIDCQADGVVCGIQIRNDHYEGGVYDQDNFTPVTFATAEEPATGVTVTPTVDLDAAGDTVTVKGNGYAPGVGVYVRFCSAPIGTIGTAGGRIPGDRCNGEGFWANSAVPGPGTTPMVDGAFEVSLPVVGAFAGASEVFECMTAGSCGVYVRGDHTAANDYSLEHFQPLTFDPATTPPEVETPEEPTLNTVELSLAKTDGLASGEVVRATGAKYAPNQGLYVQFCAKPTGQLGTAAGRTLRCFPGTDGTHTVWVDPVAADGSFSVPVTVEETFELEGGDVVDCSEPGSCGVFSRRDHSGGASDYSQDAFVPVTFGGDPLPEPDPASLTADRTTDLDPAGDTVTISGQNFRPGTDYVVAVCLVEDSNICDFENLQEVTTADAAADQSLTGDAAADAAGSFTATLAVRGAFDGTTCGTDDCQVTTWAISLSTDADEVNLPVSFAAASTTGTPTGTPTASTATGTGTGALARTGSDVARMVLVGLLSLGGGSALLMVGTRRRTTA